MSTPADDDRTVITSGGPSATPPSAAPPERASPDTAAHDSHALVLGTRLAEFELIAKIGEGGFSIVYLAFDHSLERKVALKEYMPTSIASRAGGTYVSARSERHRETFEAGLRSFINEAKLLAQFDHPSLVKVYRFWEQHGTAYMVMPFYEGLTVRDTVRAMAQPPDEAWLRALLAPLTEALMVIHAEHCYHRDIAPDNVILLAGSGAPLLLDFGAARRVIGDMTHALTVILKPGYAPVEQYAEIPGMQQGAWTDVYALAAVVYWIITGKTPPASAGRLLQDSYVPLVDCAAGRYSLPFLEAIDRALVVFPQHRTQSIEVLRRELGLEGYTGSFDATRVTRAGDAEATVIRTAVLASSAPQPTTSGQHWASPPMEDAPNPPDKIARAGRGRAIAAAAALAVLAAAGGTWWVVHKPTASQAPSSATAVPPPVAPTPAPAPPIATAPAPAEVQAVPAPRPAAESDAASAAPGVPSPGSADAGPAAPPTAPATEARAQRKPARAPNAEGATAEGPKAERRVEANPNAAECARIMQRLSLGETRPELLDRVKTLNCR